MARPRIMSPPLGTPWIARSPDHASPHRPALWQRPFWPQREPAMLIEELINRGFLVLDRQAPVTLDSARDAPTMWEPQGSWKGWVASALEGGGPSGAGSGGSSDGGGGSGADEGGSGGSGETGSGVSGGGSRSGSSSNGRGGH